MVQSYFNPYAQNPYSPIPGFFGETPSGLPWGRPTAPPVPKAPPVDWSQFRPGGQWGLPDISGATGDLRSQLDAALAQIGASRKAAIGQANVAKTRLATNQTTDLLSNQGQLAERGVLESGVRPFTEQKIGQDYARQRQDLTSGLAQTLSQLAAQQQTAQGQFNSSLSSMLLGAGGGFAQGAPGRIPGVGAWESQFRNGYIPQGAMQNFHGVWLAPFMAQRISAMYNAAPASIRNVMLQGAQGYRNYAGQVKAWQDYQRGGNTAARPGTSNHGWGLAIDFNATPGVVQWLRQNAGRFGLQNLPGEPWHWSWNGQ